MRTSSHRRFLALTVAPGISLFVGIASLAFAASPPAPRLESLGWMTGSWGTDSAGTRIEEHWTSPLGGVMLGIHRDVVPGRRTAFEFIRIVEDTSGLAYLAQPGGRPVTRFGLESAGEKRAVFANPAHDFPQRILYWLARDGALHARVEGTINGRLESEEWRWPKAGLQR
jgi:hypothetical protein